MSPALQVASAEAPPIDRLKRSLWSRCFEQGWRTLPEMTEIMEPIEPLPFPLERRRYRPTVALVIPVFNEERVLPMTYHKIVESMVALGLDWTVTFVND